MQLKTEVVGCYTRTGIVEYCMELVSLGPKEVHVWDGYFTGYLVGIIKQVYCNEERF